MNSTTAAEMIGKTVRTWRTAVICNKGELPESKQGKYTRQGVLWHSEELNKMATKYVHKNY